MLSILATPMSAVLAVVSFLVVLSIVVFVHEFGHFIVARWCGVAVRTFSIGFGREIGGFIDRKGTRWRIAWIPLGGYVKFIDDENAASQPSQESIARLTPEERRGAFQTKAIWQRAAVVFAGPAANFLLAIVIFAAVNFFVGVHTIAPRIGEVKPDMPAAAAGFKAGDVITSIDGDRIEGFEDIQRIVAVNGERKLHFGIDRNGQKRRDGGDPQGAGAERHLRRHVPARAHSASRPPQAPSMIETKTVGAGEAVWLGVRETYQDIASTLRGSATSSRTVRPPTRWAAPS